MRQFEKDYAALVSEILLEGNYKQCRNGLTKGLFGKSLIIDDIEKYFPIIQGRRMHVKGVLGEFAAMIRQPKHLKDFEKWGCNYWESWSNSDGSINIDYGNEWFANGQIERLKDCLLNNPNDRRMIINAWNPKHIDEGSLSLPCCHYNYQFYVVNNELSMIWTQRSVDMMIGLPSDIILAAIWLITLANEFDMKVGKVKMDLGDCHIYEEHWVNAEEYVTRVNTFDKTQVANWHYPQYLFTNPKGLPFEDFEPSDLVLNIYPNLGKLSFELKA